jgi:hypothetical protein
MIGWSFPIDAAASSFQASAFLVQLTPVFGIDRLEEDSSRSGIA